MSWEVFFSVLGENGESNYETNFARAVLKLDSKCK